MPTLPQLNRKFTVDFDNANHASVLSLFFSGLNLETTINLNITTLLAYGLPSFLARLLWVLLMQCLLHIDALQVSTFSPVFVHIQIPTLDDFIRSHRL